MQRSSPSIGTLGRGPCQGPGRAGQSGEVAGRYHPRDGPKGTEQTFRYAPLVERARHCAQDPGPT